MSKADTPTSKQWAYIRSLARDTGEKIRTPRDRRAATREIERLLRVKAAQRVQLAELLEG